VLRNWHVQADIFQWRFQWPEHKYNMRPSPCQLSCRCWSQRQDLQVLKNARDRDLDWPFTQHDMNTMRDMGTYRFQGKLVQV